MVRLSRFRRQSDEETLRFPLAVHGRVALVDAGFRAEPGMHACTSGDQRGLAKFGPESMVLPVQTAVAFAQQKLNGSLELPSLKSAIVVLTSLDAGEAGLLTGRHRDLLWRAFELPVFEQLRGPDGRIIARECEVHDGLHMEAASLGARHGELMLEGRATGCAAEVTHEHCDCGLTLPRMRDLALLRVRVAAAAAA